MNIQGATVLLTGGSRGIGEATVRKLVAEGASVVFTYAQGKEEAEQVAQETGATAVHLDLRNIDTIKEQATLLMEQGPYDVLINNAGYIQWKSISQQTDEHIIDQANINLTGLMLLTKHLLPGVKEMIINIASGAGKTAYAELVPYCATKFGLRGFSQGLAKEIKQRVYCVNPGMTKTRMTNFTGVPPEVVADVILNTMKETLGKQSGDDVDVHEFT